MFVKKVITIMPLWEKAQNMRFLFIFLLLQKYNQNLNIYIYNFVLKQNYIYINFSKM